MRCENAARAAQMEATALEVRVGNQAFDAGQLLEVGEHRRGLELVDEFDKRRGDRLDLVADHLPLLVGVAVAVPAFPGGGRERLDQAGPLFGHQSVPELDVWERPRRRELRTGPLGLVWI